MTRDHTHVLIVDDERFFRTAIRDALLEDAIPFLFAETGAEAIAQATRDDVGVMILDIQLPDMSGIDVLRAVRETRPDLRVVVLSSHSEQEYILEALRLGAVDYLAKPLHEEELRLSVHRALDSFTMAHDWTTLSVRLGALAEVLEASDDLSQDTDDVVFCAGRMVEWTSELVGAAKTSLLLRDEGGDTLRVVAAQGHKKPVRDLDPVAIGSGVAGLVVARGEALFVEEIEADARFRGPRPAHYTTGSFLAVPIVHGGETLGVLCATDPEPGTRFGAEDLTLLRLLATANAASLRITPTLTPSDRELDGDIELARSVCEAMTREIDPDAVLRAALEAASRTLQADLVSLFLLDSRSGTLRLVSEWAGRGAGDHGILSTQNGLSGTVYATGTPVASDECESHPRYDATVDTASGPCAPLAMVVPIQFRKKTLGVARVFGRSPQASSPKSAELLGASLSAAVRNTSLYRSLVDSIEELALARRQSS